MGNSATKTPEEDTKKKSGRELADALQLRYKDSPKLKRLGEVSQAEVDAAIRLMDKSKPREERLVENNTNMTSFELSRLGLKSLPPNFGSLKGLTSLTMAYNLLERLPAEFCSHAQTSLTYLSLTGNLLQSLDGMSALVNLKTLIIRWNWLDKPEWLTSLTNLEHLDLAHNKGITVPDLKSLSKLRYLDLSECDATIFPTTGVHPALCYLNLSYSMFGNVPETIAECTELLVLNLSNCKGLKSISSKFSNLSKLETFMLSGTQITELPDSFGEPGTFPALRKFEMSPTQCKDFPTQVCAIASLRELSVGGHTFSVVPDALPTLTNLTKLVVSYNKFGEDIPSVVFELSSLKHLNVAGNGLKNISKDIVKLSSLEFLNVAFNALASLPAHLANLPELCSLHIAGNPFTDPKLLNLYFEKDSIADLLAHISEHAPEEIGDRLLKLPMPAEVIRGRADQEVAAFAKIPDGSSTLTNTELRNKIYGLFFGAAVGDAVGLATEFLKDQQAQFFYGCETVELTSNFFLRDNHRIRWVPGDFTDDTDQMLLILENFLENQGKFDHVQFADNLLRWAYSGFPELGDTGGMGIGATVSAVLRHEDFLTDPHKAATETWIRFNKNAAANGAVMRTSFLGIPSFWDLDKVSANTLQICDVTHVDPRCRASCIVITAIVAQLLAGKTETDQVLKEAFKRAEKLVPDTDQLRALRSYVFDYNIADMKLSEASSIGFTFKCMGSGVAALRSNDFHSFIMKLIMEAGDADTNGAVAGAVLGCKLGFTGIPEMWVNGLVHRDWLAAKVEMLCGALGL